MKFSYRLVSSMCKVFPSGEGPKERAAHTLTGLRGETVSFQIACRWDEWGRNFGTVEVESPLPVRVRTVELSPCQYPCHPTQDEGYLATEPGLYPDLLRELGPWGFPLISGQWRSLWVDVELGEDVPAGEYPVSITLKIQGEEAGQCQITCKVLGLSLPKLPVPRTEWFHSDCLANYYRVEVFSEKYWEIVEAFVRTAAKRHCNMLLTPVFTPPLDTAEGGERRTVQLVDVEVRDGKYSFGFEKFRRWVKMALDCGMEYIEISHLFSQWGAKAAPKIMGTANGAEKQLFGWDTDAGGQEYGDFLRQFLRALKEELRALEEEQQQSGEVAAITITSDMTPEEVQAAMAAAAEAAATAPTGGADIMDINTEKSMELRKTLRQFVQTNPEVAAQMLKTWLRGEEESNG